MGIWIPRVRTGTHGHMAYGAIGHRHAGAFFLFFFFFFFFVCSLFSLFSISIPPSNEDLLESGIPAVRLAYPRDIPGRSLPASQDLNPDFRFIRYTI